ncbi:MAG: sulfite exporter TauE/SafE family protein [Bacteroidales bacterium]|nr:sulfite exporter TauE/SafE family protein [Bacteroidales bacterium]
MKSKKSILSFLSGLSVGTLGGLIGLGGAEFRLPLLIGLFKFGALPAIIINKAISLVVVASSLPLRASTIPFEKVFQRWDVIVTLLGGSLAGAWIGAGWATRIKSNTLYRILSTLLIIIAVVLLFGHSPDASAELFSSNLMQRIIGIIAGFFIGIVAAIMGVAGGELLIPTIILLFGVDIKLAGSLSLAVSLPTMLTGFTRYSRDSSFSIIKTQKLFIITMAAGSIAGTFIGSRLLGIIPEAALLPVLAVILVISAVKVWRHK